MEGYLKPIGGEYWFDFELFNKSSNNFKEFNDSNTVYLSGGQSAIQFILETIKPKADEYILVPSYLCPTILLNFTRLKVNFEFYVVNKDLSINLSSLSEKIKSLKIKAFFFIDYFGFYHDEDTLRFIKSLRNKNIIIIEDAVQMFWFSNQNFIGDFVFNSFRKFVPLDGSIVLSNINKNYQSVKDKYYNYINIARLYKTAFIKFHIGSEKEYLYLFKKAEEKYYSRENILGMNEENKMLLSSVDFDFISKKRKENYEYLFYKLKSCDNVKIIFNIKRLSQNVPLGFPILIEDRDEVRKYLSEKSIFCPIHWQILNEKWSSNFKDSEFISKRILTLPIDHRYDFHDLDRLINELVIL